MSTSVAATTSARAERRHWIDHWEPENEQFWQSTGRTIARRNLALSIFAEHLGFSIWVLWTIVVINLANVGIAMSVPEQFWLTALPNLIGSALRVPYTFAVPRFGGRLWTCISASLLFIPALLQLGEGALRMGLLHGVYCLGCCWLLFVILFPLGIMNIAVMAVLTLVIFAEKTLPWGRAAARAAAVALIAYGSVVVAAPQLLPTFAAGHEMAMPVGPRMPKPE